MMAYRQGLQDLKAGIIRTPLAAETTFTDDPLRILRAIRFASRLEFALHKDIVDAASKPHVRTALGCKISRERIGKELEGMLSGTSPVDIFTVRVFHLLVLARRTASRACLLLHKRFGAA